MNSFVRIILDEKLNDRYNLKYTWEKINRTIKESENSVICMCKTHKRYIDFLKPLLFC